MIIYKATSPSKKSYVGLTTKSLKERKRLHNIYANKEKALPFHRAIRKYGMENFEWVILESGVKSLSELKEKEIYYIKKYDTYKRGYNCTLGGDGIFGYKFTKEQKNMISKKTKDAMNNPLVREKIAKGGGGKVPKNSIPIIDSLGNTFLSITHAAKHYNISSQSIRWSMIKKVPASNNLCFCKMFLCIKQCIVYTKPPSVKKGTKMLKYQIEKLRNTSAGKKIIDSNGTLYRSISEASRQLEISRDIIKSILDNKAKKHKLRFYYV